MESPKIKVLCLIDTLGMGGAERQMVGLATFLAARGYDTNLVIYHKPTFYEQLAEQYNISIHYVPCSGGKLSKLRAIARHIKGAGGYDWVIAYKGGATQLACLLRMLGGNFRLIVSERSTEQVVSCATKLKYWLYRWADYIVPNSHAQAAFISKHFPHLSERVATITNYTDIQLFVPPAEELRSQDAPLEVLTVARVTPAKNILNYLRGIRRAIDLGLGSVRFDWYGATSIHDRDYVAEVHRLIEELDLGAYIHFHDGVVGIVEKYQRCDVFCLPSLYEGYPNVLCEAMSCAKPILCSRVCDNPLIVREEENGLLFSPEDIEDIAQRLLQMSRLSHSDRLRMGQTNRQRALEMFSPDSFVSKYIDLIEVKKN